MDQAKAFAKELRRWLSIIGVVAAILIAAYLYNFWRYGKTGLSDQPDAWGQFGDYVGGTLGALLSFAAFAGVLLTVHLQRQQIVHMKAQVEIDQLQRLLERTAEAIDVLLQAEVPGPRRFDPMAGRSGSPFRVDTVTIRTLLAGAGTIALNPTAADVELRQKIADQVRAHGMLQFGYIAAELDQLASVLESFLMKGGGASVADFYVRRYAPVTAWAGAVSVQLSERVRRVFSIMVVQSALAPEEDPPTR